MVLFTGEDGDGDGAASEGGASAAAETDADAAEAVNAVVAEPEPAPPPQEGAAVTTAASDDAPNTVSGWAHLRSSYLPAILSPAAAAAEEVSVQTEPKAEPEAGTPARKGSWWSPSQLGLASPRLPTFPQTTVAANGNEAREEGEGLLSEVELASVPKEDLVAAVSPREQIVRLVVPGEIFHAYEWRGQTRCAVIDYTHPSMRKVILSHSMVDDHLTDNWILSLREIASAKACRATPPEWESIPDSDNPSEAAGKECGVCKFPMRWQFIGNSPTEVARVSHHCRSCGKIVCEACSDNKMSLPHIGVGRSSRVCDHCAIFIM